MKNLILIQNEEKPKEFEAHSSLVHLCKKDDRFDYKKIAFKKFPFSYNGWYFTKLSVNQYKVNKDFFNKKYSPYVEQPKN